MINLKWLKNPVYSPKVRARIRVIRPNKEPRLRRLKIRPGKGRKEEYTRKDEKNKPVTPWPPEIIQYRPQLPRAKKRNNEPLRNFEMTFSKSSVITVIRKTLILGIVSS